MRLMTVSPWLGGCSRGDDKVGDWLVELLEVFCVFTGMCRLALATIGGT